MFTLRNPAPCQLLLHFFLKSCALSVWNPLHVFLWPVTPPSFLELKSCALGLWNPLHVFLCASRHHGHALLALPSLLTFFIILSPAALHVHICKGSSKYVSDEKVQPGSKVLCMFGANFSRGIICKSPFFPTEIFLEENWWRLRRRRSRGRAGLG